MLLNNNNTNEPDVTNWLYTFWVSLSMRSAQEQSGFQLYSLQVAKTSKINFFTVNNRIFSGPTK